MRSNNEVARGDVKCLVYAAQYYSKLNFRNSICHPFGWTNRRDKCTEYDSMTQYGVIFHAMWVKKLNGGNDKPRANRHTMIIPSTLQKVDLREWYSAEKRVNVTRAVQLEKYVLCLYKSIQDIVAAGDSKKTALEVEVEEIREALCVVEGKGVVRVVHGRLQSQERRRCACWPEAQIFRTCNSHATLHLLHYCAISLNSGNKRTFSKRLCATDSIDMSKLKLRVETSVCTTEVICTGGKEMW